MTIHKEGYKILGGVFLILLTVNIAFWQWITLPQLLMQLVLGLSCIAVLFVAYFFRKPRRNFFTGDKIVLAPADGKIVAIEEVEEGEYFKDKRLQVSIFMSPSNVHINWSPVSGIVKYIKYHPGKYLVAWHPKSSTNNERNTVVIEYEGEDILIRQIAGFLARRIVHYTTVGQEIEQGNEMGFIKFGSRVDIFLPLDAVIDVQINQKVKGGQTVIARFTE